ncbi:MAG: DUF1223 domain-containing protein [Rhodomicrobium sp.]|nr:DUF1223 domain-containing protein [Rhodomicrobium sp.]
MNETAAKRSDFRKRLAAGVFRLAAGALFLTAASETLRASEQTHVDVLELFTSQGCSSCPPADALIQEISKREGVIALSLPVSYWDHLGWKDTLAKQDYNERQRGYAEARGDRDIYTPQLVVNGIAHVVGSRRDAIDAALRSTRRSLKSAWVAVSVRRDGDTLTVDTAGAPEGSAFRSGKLWLAAYSSSVTVAIGRGENHGRQVTYTNVVRTLTPVGAWNGEAASYTVKLPAGGSFDGCAVFLQADRSYAMLGAANLFMRAK